MNTHPLEVIERLIDVELRRRSYTQEEFDTFIFTLRMELNRLLWHPLNLVDMERNEEKLEKHVRLYQHSLLGLMDTVANYLPVEEHQKLKQFNPVFGLMDGYKVIFSCLQKYLVSMERAWGHHMQIDYRVPVFYLGIDNDSVKANLRLIKDKLSNAGIDDGYWTILRKPLNDLFVRNDSPKIPYMQLAYLDELYKELIKLLSEKNSTLQESLQYLLISLNFNDSRYVSYVTGLITKETDEILDTREKLRSLFYWEKNINQVSAVTGVSYKLSEPPLQQQLQHWITERITLLEKEPRTLQLSDLDPETEMHIRLATSMRMSARQLNQYLKIVMEEDFYKKNKEDVDYLFSTFCITVPEDNPDVNKILSVLKVTVKLKRLKSRLWL